jgi:hypothetical protein
MIRHQFWGAGEPDCPPELKASNGELHTVRCKVCGDNWRKSFECLTAFRANQQELCERWLLDHWRGRGYGTSMSEREHLASLRKNGDADTAWLIWQAALAANSGK